MTSAVPVSYQIDERLRTIPERSLGDVLSESFAIFGRHLGRFIGIVAVVQVPVTLLSLVPSSGAAVFAIAALISVLAGIVGYGATIFAVGQLYARGHASIAACYSRVWWRVLPLAAVAVVVAAVSLGWEYLGVMAVSGRSVGASVGFVLIAVPLLALIVYAVFTPQVVIMEGLKPVEAVKRSYQLVRGSWLRVFGAIVVLGLVAAGLGIVMSIPFAAAIALSGLSSTSFAARAIVAVNGLVVSIAVLPVIFSGITLLYYDMRVRKEAYDLSRLSQEAGAQEVVVGG